MNNEFMHQAKELDFKQCGNVLDVNIHFGMTELFSYVLVI